MTTKTMLLAVMAAALFATAGAHAGTTQIQERMQCSHEQIIKGGDSVPWPWGDEVELPADHLSGLWRVVKSDCESYFAFVPTNRKISNGTYLKQVVQYSPVTCDKIAWGYGTETDRVLRSSMSTGTKSFNLTVRAFPRATAYISSKASVMTAENMVIVLTMYPKKGWSQRVSYELEKVSKDAKPTCQTPAQQ